MLRSRLPILALTATIALMLSGCGADSSSGGGNETMSYKDMKTMVIDILKTEDAQKALQESAAGMTGASASGPKLLTAQDQENVRVAVKDVLVAPEYDKVLKSLMTDTRFAGEFAKAVNQQNKQIHKDLMKDPAYQKDLVQVMKNPEMDKMILDVLQSTQYRKQVMTIMQESMQNPLFRVEVLDLMKQAVKEELQPKPNEKVEKSGEGSGGGDESSGEGGDNSDSAGGGGD